MFAFGRPNLNQVTDGSRVSWLLGWGGAVGEHQVDRHWQADDGYRAAGAGMGFVMPD
jgi:hypothetical protein